jgi:hypothetical protein
MIIEMVLELGTKIIQLNSEGIEKFPVGEGSIDIANDDHVSSLIEVLDDIPSLDLAVRVCIGRVLPLSEVHMTMMWPYLKRS